MQSGTVCWPKENHPDIDFEICNDGVDNDNNQRVDCEDPQCADNDFCREGDDLSECTDNADNDGDGAVDCEDSECAETAPCMSSVTVEDCGDGADNDGDGDIDCADSDCGSDDTCIEGDSEAECSDGVDNNQNGLVDCEEDACSSNTLCIEGDIEAECFDDIDNDQNGLTDCQEESCAGACIEEGAECSDGADNNENGLIDCEEDSCADDSLCIEADPPTFERYETIVSSYLDGDEASDGTGWARDIAVDANGDFVVVGGVNSPVFPTTEGAWDRDYGDPGAGIAGGGEMDVFVSKFNASGALVWSTYLGGAGYDFGYAVEFADNGDVIVAGRAGPGFPTTPGVVQESFAGDNDIGAPYGPQDGFVARLSADGSQLVWSTYFGSVGPEFIQDLDIDASGRVLVALTLSGSLSFQPELAGPRTMLSGTRDAYYGKLSSDGRRLLFGTYIGGSDGDSDGGSPSIRAAGDEVYVVTTSNATDVDCITQGAHQPANAGGTDIILVHFDANNALTYGTYFGGSDNELMETHQLAIDPRGNAYFSGGTGSSDLPVLPNAAQPEKIHDQDGFISKFSPEGALLAATYVGIPSSAGSIIGLGLEGLAVAPNGDIVAGGSDRPNDATIRRAIVARANEDLSELLYVEYFGGSGHDEFRAIDVSAMGDVYYAGHTTSEDWPIVSAYDSNYSCEPHRSTTFTMFRPLFQSP